MDGGEIIDAAARAIHILGEGALGTSAEDLVTLALDLAVEHDVGLRSLRLMAVADALSRADSAGRSAGVLELFNAATALEDSLGVDLQALGGGASELARACREHVEAARGVGGMRHAAAGREDQDDEEHPGPWLWLLLRGKRNVQQRRFESSEMTLNGALLVKEDAHPPPQGTHDSAMIKCLEKESRRLERYLPLARSIQEFADDLGVPHPDLTRATERLEGAGDVNAAVAELGTAATELEREATARLRALRAPVAQLAQACREHQRAAAAMEAVQRAAEERARQRESASVAVQIERPPAPAADQGVQMGPGQGDQRRADMQGYALCGWFSLVPYLAASKNNDEKLKALSVDNRWKINLALSSYFTVVTMGVLLNSSSQYWFVRFLSMVSSRVGLLGINVFAIFFVYWILGINDPSILHISLGVSFGLHFLMLILKCARRDV